MFSIISLPDNFISSTTLYASTIFTDLAPYITLILGVFLGVIVLEIVIGAIRGHK